MVSLLGGRRKPIPAPREALHDGHERQTCSPWGKRSHGCTLGVGTNLWGSAGKPLPEMAPVFSAALEMGLGFFDTAEIYGRGGSERTLGRLLKGAGRRPLVLSKFFPFPWRVGRTALQRALRASLARLGLERVDVYLLHFPLPPVPLVTWADALADAAEAGLTRAVGISNCAAGKMRAVHAVLAARGLPLACNEVEFNLLNRGPERTGLLSACRDLGVTLIAYRPLALGALAAGAATAGSSAKRRLLHGRACSRRVAGLPGLLARIGAAHGGKTPSQVSLNWVMRKGGLPIPGARSEAHLRENAGALGWSLTEEEITLLDSAGS
jgi:aryl-alcohol dehydrogenase-like predicted oxidoreductase